MTFHICSGNSIMVINIMVLPWEYLWHLVIYYFELDIFCRKKSKEYELPQQNMSTTTLQEPNKNAYVDTVHYTDIPAAQFSAATTATHPRATSPFSQYLILQQPCPAEAKYTLQRTPQPYDGRVFIFPDVASQGSRTSHSEITTNSNLVNKPV